MKMLEKIYGRMRSCASTVSAALLTFVSVLSWSPMPVYAADTGAQVGWGTNTGNADTMIQSAAGLMLKAASYVGFLLMIWGLIQLILAFKNEDADSKSRAIMTAVTGALLFGLRSILQAAHIIT